MPVCSYTSYTGGPNSNWTGAPGDLAVNVVASGQTARLYVKEQTSGKTGWVSFVTIGSLGTYSASVAAQGTGLLVSGATKVLTAAVTSAASIFLTDTGGGVLANIGGLYVNGVTSGVSFAVGSSNALDGSSFNWLITRAP